MDVKSFLLAVLSVGIPREIKPREKRVGLTPAGVKKLAEAGIAVFVEKRAGEASGFSDPEYQAAGAAIVNSAREVYQRSGLIQKVKEPLPAEYPLLKRDLILFSFLHLASPEHHALARVLLEKRVTALGYETASQKGYALFLAPMSAIAGTLAAYFAGFFKQYVRVAGSRILHPARFLDKMELLASGYPAIPEIPFAGRAVVFGGGVVGRNATRTLLGMNWSVEVVEKQETKRLALRAEFQSHGDRFRVHAGSKEVTESLREADAWFGCVHTLGERAARMVTEQDLVRLSKDKPKLILDIAVDQGGNFPESHSTTYDNPLYLDSCGNLRFGVANIPSLSGRPASEALEKATLPFTLALAREGKPAIQKFEELQTALQVEEGRILNVAVARAVGGKS